MSTEMDLSTALAAVKALLKEQTQQMAEMASMMKSMSLAMPLLEEQVHKLQKEKEAEAVRKKAVEELERKSKAVAEQLVKERVERQAERAAKMEADKAADKAAKQLAQERAAKALVVTNQTFDPFAEDEEEYVEDHHAKILHILGASRWRANTPTPPSGPSYPNGFPGGPVPPQIFVPVNCPPGAYPIPCPRVRGGRY